MQTLAAALTFSLHSPPSFCSEYQFSISCRLHDGASLPLLLFLPSPGWGGDKSYLQVTVGNGGNLTVGKFFFFTLFSLKAEPPVMLRGELHHSASQS